MAASFMSRIGLTRSPKIDYSRLQKPQKAWPAYEDASPQDTSMNSPDVDDSENEPAQYPRHHSSNGLRGGLFILIGMVIGLLAGSAGVWVLKTGPMSPVSGVKEFAPQMPLKTVVFEEIKELYDSPTEENQKYWDAMAPPGKGFVQIENPEDYDLLPGILTQTGIERFSVAMYHQLHCLALLRRYYWHLIDAISNGWHEDARQEMVRQQLHNHHPHHCFAYIAQSMQCSADLTIEWARVESDGRRFQVEGWGVPHQCKDPKAVMDWAMKHHSPPRPNHTHIDD